MNNLRTASIAGALCLLTFQLNAAEFSAPVRLTDSAAIYRLSRTPSAHMDFDSSGTLHVVYWSGDFSTSPSQSTTPSPPASMSGDVTPP